jgi:hypothetical protein
VDWIGTYLLPVASDLSFAKSQPCSVEEKFMTVLLPDYKHRGTWVSCLTLRERCRPIRIGEVFAVVLD